MTPSGSRLDILMATCDFNERHSRMVDSEPDAVCDAFRALTPREMPASRLLFAVRSLPGRLVVRTGCRRGGMCRCWTSSSSSGSCSW
jgi:hypothetical protein